MNQTVVGHILPEVARQTNACKQLTDRAGKQKGAVREKKWSGEERTVKLRLSYHCPRNSVRGSMLTSGQASPGCSCRMVM